MMRRAAAVCKPLLGTERLRLEEHDESHERKAERERGPAPE
jgi:hypothetical protein